MMHTFMRPETCENVVPQREVMCQSCAVHQDRNAKGPRHNRTLPLRAHELKLEGEVLTKVM